MKKFIIYTDGGSRGNPGKAAAAFVIQDENGHILTSKGIYLGIATNNQAEYQAVKFALQAMKKDYVEDLPAVVEMRADSQLIVNQLMGRYKIKNQELKLIIDEINNLRKEVGQVIHLYIPREKNFLADKLVNQALDLH